MTTPAQKPLLADLTAVAMSMALHGGVLFGLLLGYAWVITQIFALPLPELVVPIVGALPITRQVVLLAAAFVAVIVVTLVPIMLGMAFRPKPVGPDPIVGQKKRLRFAAKILVAGIVLLMSAAVLADAVHHFI